MEKGHENEKQKCFVIMPISDQDGYQSGHFQKVYDQIFIPAIEEAGYTSYRVDENKISDSIITKIFAAIQDCPMAICDLSSRNPNVLYELGLRQAYDMPVVLVQDEKTNRIFDVSGINTIEYSSSRLYEAVIKARQDITDALIATKEGKEKTLVKVVKAKTADYNSVNVSSEDRLDIQLKTIQNDIRDLKYYINTENDSRYDTYSKKPIQKKTINLKTRIHNDIKPSDLRSDIIELNVKIQDYNNGTEEYDVDELMTERRNLVLYINGNTQLSDIKKAQFKQIIKNIVNNA